MEQNQVQQGGQAPQPQFTVPFDVIELPSKGVLYPTKKATLKVEYLTAMDENLLTSPNLLRNGNVFDMLLERKVKDSELRPADMLIGDRNAIIIFLRATGYGHEYPVKLVDPNTYEEFEYMIDLNSLSSKPLGAQPDENNEFIFTLPKSNKVIKFRLLTGKDEDEIIKISEKKAKSMGGMSNMLTMRLERQIMEIDGDRDGMMIQQFVNYMPAFDSLQFRTYSESIEPGIDMMVEVEGPSGSRFQTSVPIGSNFFWPNA